MKVKIDRFGINGEGVFKCTEGENLNKVGFVPFALPDEIVDVEIINNKKSYCEAKLNKIIKSSINRIDAKCPYFTICGGCNLQHVKIDTQIKFKHDKIKEIIERIAKISDIKIKNVIHVNDYEYRNKMVFPFGIKSNKLILGMYKNGTRDIVDINECILAKAGINHVFKLSKDFFESSDRYNILAKNKILKHLVIREYNNQYLITLVVSKRINIIDYCEYISSKIAKVGFSIIIGTSDDEILVGKYEYVIGLERLDIEEFGLKYSVDNRGFLQINNEIKALVYNCILDNITSEDIVIDGYSGAGLLTSIIAKKCRKAIGIEINNSSHKSAENMSKINGLHNTMFYCADVKDIIGDVLKKHIDSVLVLDPARSGCDSKVLDKIQEYLPKKIIYLSCNVATLARDLGKLKDNYVIHEIIGYDMFPNTKHIETLVIMHRKK